MMNEVKKLFGNAVSNKYAIPAYNVTNALMFKTVVEAAEAKNAPVLITLSEAHLPEFSLEEAVNLYEYYKKRVSVPIVLHLDHGQTLSVVKEAIDLGFPSVMIDASQDSFEDNVSKTKEIVDYAKMKDVFVEAEIGHVGSNYGTSEAEVAESKYTEVEDAVKFVELTGVDSLAVSVGTAHGPYRGTPHINFERLEVISKQVNIPLVLHGGSSSGDENLNKAKNYNIAKINVFTDVVVAAMENLEGITDYVELTHKIDENMKKCLTHYFDVFETTKWSGQ